MSSTRFATMQSGLHALSAIALCLIGATLAAPARGAELSSERFDRALHRHVRDGVVDYPAIGGDADFRAYLNLLAAPAQLSSKAERLAYFMNAYNALAIEGILEGSSPASLIGRVHFFKVRSWRLNGESISLQALERDVILPLGEPRIHFAIVCASKSCPKLRSEAYTADALERQLEDNARAFINDPSRNRFDDLRKVARLSEIFKWYEDDFSRAAGSLQKYLARYASGADTARDLQAERFRIEWVEYDWSLNGTSPAR